MPNENPLGISSVQGFVADDTFFLLLFCQLFCSPRGGLEGRAYDISNGTGSFPLVYLSLLVVKSRCDFAESAPQNFTLSCAFLSALSEKPL